VEIRLQLERKGILMRWNRFGWSHAAESTNNKRLVRFRPVLETMEERLVPTVLDPNFTESTFVDFGGNFFSTGMEWAPDGSNRLFVLRKNGVVRIVQDGTIVATPFATISPVFTNSECGLIGMTFDRDYVNNRYIYFFVTVSNSQQQIIRYTDTNNIGTDKTTIVSNLPTVGNNHDGGGLGIGLDNKLYWSIGDLGNGTGVDNNLTSLAAKVGRANLDGTPVSDNPFNDNDGIIEPTDYIWARGFRNPFTMTFQESTGQLWVNVVGTNYEQSVKVNAGDHFGYNDFEGNQPTGYIQPEIVYRTNSTDSRTVSTNGAVRNNNVVTFTYNAVGSGTAFLQPGNRVTVSGVADSSFNGVYDILSVISPTQFSVADVGPDATSSGGTIVTAGWGGCITGGAFYTSTTAPAAYRGNLFFGDFNSGRIMRATLDSNNNITSVSEFANNFGNIVDVTVGPDGALYYVSAGGSGVIRRTAYNVSTQGLIVTDTAMNLVEGGNLGMTVRLATAPSGDVTVTVARTAGDSDLSVSSGATLTFTPANWNAPQPVVLVAAQDADTTNDSATFLVSTNNGITETVNARAIDNDTQVLILNTSSVTIDEGGAGTFTVALQNAPTGIVTVNVAHTSGDSDVAVTSGATLTFNAGNFSVPQTVTLSAAEDADIANDSAGITVSATGANPRIVDVTVIDNDPLAPSIVSSAVTAAIVNVPYTYDVDAAGTPSPTYSLDVFPSGMTIDPTTGVISWTPTSTGPASVTVRAQNGIAPDATQSFTITVNPDAAPTAVLTRPTAGEVVFGTNAEFFGDGFDDVGTVRAEFYVDDVLQYTDINNSGHYHFGGNHLLWDTTLYSNGSHTVRMVVVDTIGQTGFAETTVTIANPPTITGITPISGPTTGGTLVTITGTKFMPGATVQFGANAATNVIVNSDTQITAVAPAGTGVVDVRVTTSAGLSSVTPDCNFTYVSEPILVSTVVNGGDPELQNLPAEFANQRSMVRSVQLTFDHPVTLSSSAVTLAVHANPLVPNPTLPGSISILNASGGTGLHTVWNVTFGGANVIGGSIGDGEYDLNVIPSQVVDQFGQTLAAAPPTFTFYRLLGDADGNRTVSNLDIINVRRQLGKTSAAPNYPWLFDTDWNGTINNVDIVEFRRNANRSI
jgi:glucose/arabinose dehydrogenase